MTPRVLGVDPSMRRTGLVAYDLETDAVAAARVVATERATRKRADVYVGSDDARCLGEIVDALSDFRAECGDRGPVAVCIETRVAGRGSRAVSTMASSWATVVAAARIWNLPLFHATPFDVKEAAGLPKNASKDDVAAAVRAAHPEVERLLEQGRVPEGQREHIYDAVGAVKACLRSDHLQMIRRMLHLSGPRSSTS